MSGFIDYQLRAVATSKFDEGSAAMRELIKRSGDRGMYNLLAELVSDQNNADKKIAIRASAAITGIFAGYVSLMQEKDDATDDGKWIAEIREERGRQIKKGYDAKHDDQHTLGQLADAAAHYATCPWTPTKTEWPFDDEATTITDERRKANLVKAAALILAELERLDRLP